MASGQWATLSIPLADVDWFTQRRKQQQGVPDLNNMAAYMIEFATEKDIGLTLGRIWVTEDDEDARQK